MKVTTAKYYIPSGRCIQAIDYAQTRENGEVYSIPDSLRKEFKTKNGRIVRDGAGIEPDEMIESKTYAPITYSLVARNHVFDYATEYFYKHPSIGKPREFSITDQEYQNFIKWLKGKEYDYTTYLEKSVSDMKKNAENAPFYNEIKDQIEALEKRVNHSKEQDLITYKDEVKKVISEEIVSRYYFQEGMIEAGLLKDKDVLKALEVIKQPSELGKILTASAK